MVRPETRGDAATVAWFMLAVTLWGCGPDTPLPSGGNEPLFPEIWNMALVVSGTPKDRDPNAYPGIYFIDRYEVTNGEYFAFLRDRGYAPEDRGGFLDCDDWTRDAAGIPAPRPGSEDLPVRMVNFNDALAYARSQGKDLPAKEQYLTAALGEVRYTTQFKKSFPWGKGFQRFYCNSLESGICGPARVGTFEKGKSLWGCYDMVGNVAEWTCSPVEGAVPPSCYILGGSWADAGIDSEGRDSVLHLDRDPPQEHAEQNNRYTTLGFRCVRTDALAYIRDTFAPRFAALPLEERERALQEVSDVHPELYTVLKLVEFDGAVTGRLPLRPDPSLVLLLPEGPSGGCRTVLLGYEDGALGRYGLDGSCRWTGMEPGALGETCLISPNGRDGPARVVLWKDRVAVLDGEEGKAIWRADDCGAVQSLLPVKESPGEKEDFLVHWYLEDRNQKPRYLVRDPFALLRSPEDIFNRIRFYAGCLLTREGLTPPTRRHRLALFTDDPEAVDVEGARFFGVSNLGLAELYLQEALQHRYRIMLYGGSFWRLEEILLPGSGLKRYDGETGVVRWSLDFPDDLFTFHGAIRQKPLIVQQGRVIVLVLERHSTGEGAEELPALTLVSVDAGSGAVLDRLDLEISIDRLSPLAVCGDGPDGLVGVLDSELLLMVKVDSGGRLAMQERSLPGIIRSLDEGVVLPGEPAVLAPKDFAEHLAWLDFATGMIREDALGEEPPSLYPLWTDSGSPLWLLTEPDWSDQSLLFTGFEGGAFRKAFLLRGAYNRVPALDAAPWEREGFVLFRGGGGNMVAFDWKRNVFLWEQSLRDLEEVRSDVADMDGDGTLEAFLASTSGGIRMIDLETGRLKRFLQKVGASYTFILPVCGDPGRSGTILAGVKDEGFLLLDTLKDPVTVSEQNLHLTLKALEAWQNRDPGP